MTPAEVLRLFLDHEVRHHLAADLAEAAEAVGDPQFQVGQDVASVLRPDFRRHTTLRLLDFESPLTLPSLLEFGLEHSLGLVSLLTSVCLSSALPRFSRLSAVPTQPRPVAPRSFDGRVVG